MSWYIFAYTRAGIDHGAHDELFQFTQARWEANGRPPDFALLGPRRVNTDEGVAILCYLSPAAQKYCSDGFFSVLEPNQVTDIAPNREGLEVAIGAAEALQLFD